MRSHGWAAATAAVLLGVTALEAGAQSCSGNPCTVQVTASATVNDLLSLTLSSVTTNLGTPTAADFAAGFLDAAGPTATVSANRAWHVDVVGNAAVFTYTGAGTNPNKPASDLQWGTSAGAYPNDMSSSTQLFSGAATNGSSQDVFFRTLWNFAASPAGTYDLVINFTLAAP
ncbi:MAG TPA: hypothetical protein VLE53_02795 [Gemmatimonadaceae bacterium]|nr:hypothetical protein [Gemmatimonadaceae bacterium]